LEFLLQTPLGSRVEARLVRDGTSSTFRSVGVEVVQGSTSRANGDLSAVRAGEAIEALTNFDLSVTPISIFWSSWKLRDNITAYDAMYVALAEAIEAPIVTCDKPLANAPGHRARIELID